MRRMTRALAYWTNKEGLELIHKWAEKGLTDKEIYANMGICHQTFYTWIKDFPIITDTIKAGRLHHSLALLYEIQQDGYGVEITKIADVQTDFRSLNLLFLPEDLEKFKSAIKQASQYVSFEDNIFVARLGDFEKLLKAQNVVKESYKIENAAEALTIILDIFNRHLDDLSKGYTNEKNELKHLNDVPLESVFGSDKIPSDLAVKLNKVIKKEIDKGKISENNKIEILRILLSRRKAGD